MAQPLVAPAGYQPVVNPSGEVVYLPEQSVAEGVKLYGYRLPSSQEMERAALKKEYGTDFGDELTAGVEGALSGATFGLSRHAENILGITTPEAQAARKELNPKAAFTGEVAGVAGSLLLAPGSLPGRVAQGTAKAGTAVAGRLTTNAVAREIAAKTVGSALEGMIYGGGQAISESALGDPTVTAQKVFHQIGIGGLIGGGFGFATSALGVGAKKLLGKPIEQVDDVVKLDTELTGEGTITPAGQVKLEGRVEFDMPDAKIIKQAESLNPRNPLNKHDLEWLKANGLPDEAGKPTVFTKIGTPEIPTLDPMAPGKVYMGDSVKEGMKILQKQRQEFNQAADKALMGAVVDGQPIRMTKGEYQGLFKSVIKDIKESPEYGLPIGKRAIATLDKWVKAGKDMPEQIEAVKLRDILQNIRDEGKHYVKGGGLKGDFVSKSIKKAEDTLDDVLKTKSPEYAAVQKKFAPFTRKMIELEDHLGWDWMKNDSDLVSDWVTNRVAKPFQSALPGTKNDADLIRWFGKQTGVDFEKASKANFIYGKINPNEALGGQRGTWGRQVIEGGLSALSRPQEIPGQIMGGAAKVVLTGELPPMLQTFRARGVQDLLLGKSKNSGAVENILSKISGGQTSSLLEGTRKLGAPIAVQQYLDENDTLDQADNKLETLMALEKAQLKTDQLIQSAVDSIFTERTSPAPKSLVMPLPDDIEKMAGEANELMNDPNKLIDRLTASMRGLGKSAPNIAAGINLTAIRAINLLSSKLSTMQNPNAKPLDGKFVPNKLQMQSFSKTLQFINSPYDVLKEMKTGRFSKEGKEVLSTVYPELYDQMKGLVMNGIAAAQAEGKKIPVSKQIVLSFFTEQQLTGSLQPAAMMANQAAMAAPISSQNQPNPRAKASNLPANMMTPTQKIAGK